MSAPTDEKSTKTSYLLDSLLGVGLILATALTVAPLFSGDFTQNWGSIESAFLSDALFIANNYPHLGWYPYWYGGFPFRLSYTPLLPYVVAEFHSLLGWSVGHAYRVITGLAYAITPASLYALTKSVAKSRVAGLVAGLTYSLVPTFLRGMAPSHIEILTVYGEGPHILAIPFLVLAVQQLLRCMRRPSKIGYILTSCLIAVVALTNVIALFAFALFAIVALGTEIVYGKPKEALRAFFFSAVVSYGFVAFQYDQEFIQSAAKFGAGGGVSFIGLLSGPILPALLILIPVVPGLLLIVRQHISKLESTRTLFLGLIWFAVFGLIVLAKQLFELSLAPQPIRYVPELDLSLSFLIGLFVAGMIELILKLSQRRSQSFKHGVRTGITALILVALAFSASTMLLPISLRVTVPSKSTAEVPEVRIANWLSAHVTDERVYATGTVAFWLNVFSKVQQIRGGSEQGATNSWWTAAVYEINEGSDPDLSILWARAWNLKYIVVVYPNATTPYHDYIYPEKFRNILPLRYYYQGFGIYEVPLSQPALVQGISAEVARSLELTSAVLDKRRLLDYVNAVDAPSSEAEISHSQPDRDQIVISVSNASTNTAVVVKTTFDARWKAELNGEPVAISRIGPDFMVAYPRRGGNYKLLFHFDRSEDEAVGLVFSVATFLGVLIVWPASFLYLRFRRKSGPKLNRLSFQFRKNEVFAR